MTIWISPAEQRALEALFRQTGGDEWAHHEGWLSETDPGTWAGVTCERGRVTRLILPHNGLSGTLPAQVGLLAYLTELDLSSNRLTGRIPTTIGNLRALVTLNLSANDLHGALPVRLRLLQRLRVLDLHGNALTEEIPAALHDLTAIEVLDLSDNRLSGEVPPELGRLTRLVRLNLAQNDLHGPLPDDLAHLTALAAFDFSHTRLLERSTPDFQAWLAGIDSLQRTGVLYAEVAEPGRFGLAALAGASTLGAALAAAWVVAFPLLGPLAGAALSLIGVAGAGLVGQRVYQLTRSLEPRALAASAPTADETLRSQLAAEMRALVRDARSDLPPDVVERLQDIEATVAELLPRMHALAGGDPDAYLVRQTVRAYLREALAAYRALPRDFALHEPIRDGETAYAQLRHQLDLLRGALEALAERRPLDDAQRLLIHSRFLEHKFPRGETGDE